VGAVNHSLPFTQNIVTTERGYCIALNVTLRKIKHMENKVGRPTVMTPETVNKLEEGFAMGFTDEEACIYANISKQTLYDYCKKHEEYTDRKEGLKNHPKILAKTNVYHALKENKKVEDSKWYLERRDKDFKQKSDVTSNDKTLSIEVSKEISEKHGITSSPKEDSN
jgi:hypothetical protein